MLMNKVFTILFFLFLGSLSAQQTSQYSLYMLNKYNFNPAYAGLDNSLSITGVYRKQWVDLEGSPTTQNLNLHLPMYRLRGGFGINIENDLIGAERNTMATISYNYIIPVTKTSLFSIGVGAGMIQKALDGSKLRAPNGDYSQGIINHRDGLIPIVQETAIAPTAVAGIYFQNEILDIGISTNNLLANAIQLGSDTITEIQLKRNYFFNAGVILEIGSSITIQPSVLLKSDFLQTQTDFSTLIKYNDNIFVGGTFRGYNSDNIDAIAIIAGFKLSEKMTVAYAYDLTLSGLNTVSNGSHEIMLNYNLNKIIGGGSPPKIIYNPRFL